MQNGCFRKLILHMAYVWDTASLGIRYVSKKPEFSKQDETITIHKGHCHCGKVQFQVEAPRGFVAIDCDCSICVAKGILHLMVPAEKLQIDAQSLKALSTYQFHTKVARHTFCSTCGIHPFYTPRCNPESISINVRCLDPSTLGTVCIEFLDGKNFTGSLSIGNNGVYYLKDNQKKAEHSIRC
ncbi:carbon-sulfur lyase [Galdieria sulphuraria]|uniref:Carbon-sulfur lyase n=1 Tax=Galdieria sulphuraria TaxID=130081 RepID=M2XMW3_GALSU|nr:carbon-sulfur lyase [Galdieria sulphuraria]EME31532.1 carbon-sulfur lyase [Galdieria sulphuraria]|eukprot:XP_005708052.1 carbon-sulfur lyase [Galdieria sulphuraria]